MEIGRGDRIRTYDPLVPNQMRYQTALRPDKINVKIKVLFLLDLVKLAKTMALF
jgi:hypothetical protein